MVDELVEIKVLFVARGRIEKMKNFWACSKFREFGDQRYGKSRDKKMLIVRNQTIMNVHRVTSRINWVFVY